MKGNINMEKQKRITLNADKRKVIADVFQNHFEDNSKFKKAWQQAKETYNDMRSIAKTKIDVLVRTHQPQEDVDTIRGMIQSMVVVVATFTMIIVSMFKLIHQRLKKTIVAKKKKGLMMFILSLATWTKIS
jgi:hypothetical protein